MDQKQIYIHAGLHKTASTFLQHKIFPKLDSKRIYFVKREDPMSATIHQYVLTENEEEAGQLFTHIVDWLRQVPQQKILISSESYAGDPYENYSNFQSVNQRLLKIFPGAEIILVLRNQIDWILSLYKQAARGYFLMLDEFLNYRNGEFQEKIPRHYRSVEGLRFDFRKMCRFYNENYGEERFHLLFYEEFAQSPIEFVEKLQNIFDCCVTGQIDFSPEYKSYDSFLVWVANFISKIFGVAALHNADYPQLQFWEAVKKKGLLYLPVILYRRLFQRLILKIMRAELRFQGDYTHFLLGRKKQKIAQYYSQSNQEISKYIKKPQIRNLYLQVEKK